MSLFQLTMKWNTLYSLQDILSRSWQTARVKKLELRIPLLFSISLKNKGGGALCSLGTLSKSLEIFFLRGGGG